MYRSRSGPKQGHGRRDVKEALSSASMPSSSQDPARDLAQTRLDNALALFEEFVRATARHADAATLRGLERRFAERVDIQPSYWSQIKSRARQIGERLARQFEQRCHKPAGWMDLPHTGPGAATTAASPAPFSLRAPSAGLPGSKDELQPQDDDERFIIGLVLTYYRRHPQRARTRLLDLLGEVLTPSTAPPPPFTQTPLSAAAEDAQALWLRSQTGVAPLKRKK
jgi:hypothetical protein